MIKKINDRAAQENNNWMLATFKKWCPCKDEKKIIQMQVSSLLAAGRPTCDECGEKHIYIGLAIQQEEKEQEPCQKTK